MAECGTPAEMLPLFRAQFPEFDGDDDARVLLFLGIARNIFCKCEEATLFLTAHLLSMADCSGMSEAGTTVPCPGENQNSLPLTMAKVGQKQASFAKISSMQDLIYTTTDYGIIYLQLKKACLPYVFSVVVAGGC